MPPVKSSGYVDFDLENLSVGLFKNISKVENPNISPNLLQDTQRQAFVKELEKKGIGRPLLTMKLLRTFKIEAMSKVKAEDYSNKIANLVCDRLSNAFPEIMDYGFTADMGKELDSIAEGGVKDFKNFLTAANTQFEGSLLDAEQKWNQIYQLRQRSIAPNVIAIEKMLLRTNQNGQFLVAKDILMKAMISVKRLIH